MWRSHENAHDKNMTNTGIKSLEIPGCPKQFLLTFRPLRRHDPGPSHPWPEASSMSKSREATMDVFLNRMGIYWGSFYECSTMFYGVLWCSMMFYGVLWCSMVFYDVLWCSMMFYGVLWCSMMFYDVLCSMCSMMFYDVLWCSMLFPRNIVTWISCCDICDNVFVRVEFWWPNRGSAVSGCERPNQLWVKILER